MTQHLDVLIVGAGLSGITAAYRLREACPDLTFQIIEARHAIGGTWDLFRYPGVRSDSDMFTFGFAFEPWRGEPTMADGPTIRAYIENTATKYGLTSSIRYGHRLLSAEWSTQHNSWTVTLQHDGGETTLTCRYLWMCTGYYDYEQGYSPPISGLENFQGQIVHPQHWPEELDYSGRKIVVLGSGATAITLLPELAKTAQHVTMLQRSPTYFAELPTRDPWARRLRNLLPERVAAQILRWKGILYQTFVFRFARAWPKLSRRILLQPLEAVFGRPFVKRHFTPPYWPWEQRVCADADGEFLSALRSTSAAVVTDTIKGCKGKTLLLESGQELEADILVTATGLIVKLFGGSRLLVDGEPIDPAEHFLYKGTMLSNVPNLWFALGYTNMSWTLKCDLTARYVTRVLKLMNRRGLQRCVPLLRDQGMEPLRLLDFSSGYLRRADHILPKQGTSGPWRLHQSYLHDLIQTGLQNPDDGVLEFH